MGDPQVAVVVCDMWSAHWCKTLSKRYSKLADKIQDFLVAIRGDAVIIHSPGDVVDFYDQWPQRLRMRDQALLAPPAPLPSVELPIRVVNGGCPDRPRCDSTDTTWLVSQIEKIEIHEDDQISTDIAEIYTFLTNLGIKDVILVGVAANMCIMDRPYGALGLLGCGFNVRIPRDLTDVAYAPRVVPLKEYVDLTMATIEREVCPIDLSTDILAQIKNLAS